MHSYAKAKLSRREFLIGAGVALGAGALGACAPMPAAEVAPAEPAEGEPAEAPAEVSPYEGKTLTIYQQASPIFEGAFEAIRPHFEDPTGASVEFVSIPTSDLEQKITLALTDEKSGIDLTWMWYVPSWLEQGLVYPLDEFINDPNLTPEAWDVDDFIPSVWDSTVEEDGKQYSLVCTANARGFYWRSDKLIDAGYVDSDGNAKPPATWDELLEYAIQLDDPDDPPVLMMLAAKGSQAVFQWTDLWYCAGYEFVWDEDGNCIVNNEDGVFAAQRVKELLPYAPAGVLTWDFPEAHAAFQQGQGVLFPQWNNLGGIYNDAENSKAAGKFDIGGLPKITVSAGDGGNWVSYLASNSQNKELAWIYLREYTSKEWQKEFYMDSAVNFNPSRTSIYSDPDALEFAPWTDGILETLENVRPLQRLEPEWSKIEAILVENLSLYWADENDDPQATMDTAAELINEVLTESGRRS
jgi:multiple sugar transport system substrate-binding protein